jgi:hypothetical protein
MRVLLSCELVIPGVLFAVIPEQYTAPSLLSRVHSKTTFNIPIFPTHLLDHICWKTCNTVVPYQYSDKVCIDHARIVEDVVMHKRRARHKPLCNAPEDCLELGLLPEFPMVLDPAPG